MPGVKDDFARLVTGVHRFWFTVSGGRIGRRVAGMPVLMLTTTGRKSGKKRTTMLTAPIVDGDRVVLVASYGGDRRHPTWYLNLRDNAEVEMTMNGKKRKMHATVVTGDEKDELWPRVVARYRGYRLYQHLTSRDIPLVILDPA